jgi:hypothetical protein
MDQYTMDPGLMALVQHGIVTVDVHYTKTGYDVWVRSVQPHPRLGVSPHESMTTDEAVERLSKALPRSQQSPSTTLPLRQKPKGKGSGYESAPPSTSGASLLTEPPFMTLTAAQVIVQRDGLDSTIRGNGIKNVLPTKSLTRYDIERSDQQLLARAIVVANALGNQTILARIRTQESLQVKGAPDLSVWWIKASPWQRLRILSDQGKLRDETINETRSVAKARRMVCPFRGNQHQMVIDLPKTTSSEEVNWEDSEEYSD